MFRRIRIFVGAPLETRLWGAQFAQGYNFEHRHSGIRYAQRHSGQDRDILRARHELYIKAKESKPSRWSGSTRDWTPVGAVTLNPESEAVISTAVLEAENKTKEAA